MTAVKTCFSKYADFKGRARRSEFWWWFLFTIIASIVLSVLDVMLFEGAVEETGPLNSIFSLLTLLPTLAVTARRLHDIDKSGWWQLLPLAGAILMIPGFAILFSSGESPAGLGLTVLGGLAMLGLYIMLIVWYATDGHKEDNRFGYSPKYGGQVSAFD